MRNDAELTQWIHRLADGDPDAAEKLWDNYFQKLVQLARRKMQDGTLRAVDEEDIAISAMHSFCRGMVEKKFSWVSNRNDLWKLLVTLTARKVIAHNRNHYAAKRGGGAVRGESIFLHANTQDDQNHGIANVLGKEPTPDLATSVAENCQQLLGLLVDEKLRQIAIMTLEGMSVVEIAEKLGCVRRTIERKLERIREIWTTGKL